MCVVGTINETPAKTILVKVFLIVIQLVIRGIFINLSGLLLL
jgi:hypothetical protein